MQNKEEALLRKTFLKQRQSLPLNLKIEMSKRRIREFYEHFDGKVYVSFSGGKDSTVLLHLVRSIFPDVEAVFVDTGLEYPEVKEFVKTIENTTIIKPEMSFLKVIQDYGYPVISKDVADSIEQSRKVLARNDGTCTVRLAKLLGTLKDKDGNPSIYNCSRWKFLLDAPFKISYKCCEIMKKRPFHKYSKETGKRGFIATLASESRLRTSIYIKNGCNAFNSPKPYSMPLGFWTEQDILEYLVQFNVPYCKVYGDIKRDKKGKLYTTQEQRTGCMFCMFGCHLEKSPNRFQRMKLSHPKLYDYCIHKLGCGKVLDYIGVKY